MNRLYHAHLTWSGTELLEAGHQPDESDDERCHQVLGEAFVLTVAEGGNGLLLALGIKLVGVGKLFGIAARFTLRIWLKILIHITSM